MTRAIFYDGVTADRHEVEVGFTDEALRLSRGAEQFEVPWPDLGIGDEDGRYLVLTRTGSPGWRLIVDQPVDPELRARLPKAGRYGGWIDRIGLYRASALFAGVAAIVLVVGYSAPVWLAPLVPESWEENLGTAIVGDFGDNACRNPRAVQALSRMAARLEPPGTGHSPAPMTLIDVDIFNAAALPGGQIVIFDGALREAENPDAMAGILAHEIAHVRRRHVTQALIRELGIGAFIRLFAGDIGANATQLVSLSYTRSNEYEADGDAIAALERANIDPRPTAALFRKLDQEDGEEYGAVEFLDSHPATGERAKRFAASYRKDTRYSPSLNAADYKIIRTACPAKRDAEREQEELKESAKN